jgi:hypothetical protein
VKLKSSQYHIFCVYVCFPLVPVCNERQTKFEGDWKSYPAYPIPLAESHGVLIGNDFILFPGFTRSFTSNVTTKVYSYNFNDKKVPIGWELMDPFPIVQGLTHIAVAVATSTTGTAKKDVYICGGYVGPNPGPATSQCFIYQHSNKKQSQWITFPRLPQPRSAGAMLYLQSTNQLLYTAGSSRPYPTTYPFHTVDHRDTWTYDLSFGRKGVWKLASSISNLSLYPINANHVGYTSVMYKKKQRHYVLGGQQREFEGNTSISNMYEWDESTNQWITRANLLYGRGHFAAATVPYRNCGFLIIGGTRNIDQTTGDISYYDISTDTWTSIGRIPPKRSKTNVCIIHTQKSSSTDTGTGTGTGTGIGTSTVTERYLTCQTGPINDTYSWQRKIV